MKNMNHSYISLKERVEQIVDTSYTILCNKISNGDILVFNEASMQLHLGTIMKQLGVLYEFSKTEHFGIWLEAPEEIDPTQKSYRGNARCDIILSLSNSEETCEAFIELKYFKKTETEAVTDNKYSVYCDIENLERYKEKDENRLCYEIVYTDNINYTHKNNYKYCIGEGHIISAKPYEYTKNRIVRIKKNYLLKWDIYNCINNAQKSCFLKIELQ